MRASPGPVYEPFDRETSACARESSASFLVRKPFLSTCFCWSSRQRMRYRRPASISYAVMLPTSHLAARGAPGTGLERPIPAGPVRLVDKCRHMQLSTNGTRVVEGDSSHRNPRNSGESRLAEKPANDANLRLRELFAESPERGRRRILGDALDAFESQPISSDICSAEPTGCLVAVSSHAKGEVHGFADRRIHTVTSVPVGEPAPSRPRGVGHAPSCCRPHRRPSGASSTATWCAISSPYKRDSAATRPATGRSRWLPASNIARRRLI